jgi:hypothetical protein
MITSSGIWSVDSEQLVFKFAQSIEYQLTRITHDHELRCVLHQVLINYFSTFQALESPL